MESNKSIPTSDSREVLSRKQTADLLQINLSTLWHWTKKGKVQSYGIEGKVYYLRSEILNSLTPLNRPS
ncbi:helix-turn-helix domain-containing protein [uncultured Arcticibacterium sp.]|uniref:helix-turn-helix domain-containing protein n=1 Tax=uncultured Arcticibacterium sp. TaxID=2173042 RepID=UPI0030FA315E